MTIFKDAMKNQRMILNAKRKRSKHLAPIATPGGAPSA